MSETQNNSFAASESDELDTTPPNPVLSDATAAVPHPAAPGKWEMPKPVFRRTSGKLASSFEKRAAPEMYRQAESPDGGSEGSPKLESAGSTDNIEATHQVTVEPQPELAEVLIPDALDEPKLDATHQGNSRSYGLLFTLLGLALILGLFALILAAVYFFFLRPAANGSLF